MCSLEDAPEEVLLKVFSHLDSRSLVRMGCACRRFRALAGDENLWKRLLHLDFGDDALLLVSQRFSGKFKSTFSQATQMHSNPLFTHFKHKIWLRGVAEATERWAIEIREPGTRWHNNGKLLFQADAIFAGYTGQCMALMCFLPGRYIGNASAPGWTYIVGCPNNGPPFVLSCARLSHSSGSSPAQVWPTPWFCPRDGDLKVTTLDPSKTKFSRRPPEGQMMCLIFIHAEQTSLGHFATSQQLCRLKRPVLKAQKESARVFIDVFDHRKGVQLCSLIAVANGHPQIPRVPITLEAWFSWGLENLMLEVGAREDSLLVADICIHEFGRRNGSRTPATPGLFAEPLSRLECTVVYEGDVAEVLMMVVVESGASKFFCKLALDYNLNSKQPFLLSVAKANRCRLVRRSPSIPEVPHVRYW